MPKPQPTWFLVTVGTSLVSRPPEWRGKDYSGELLSQSEEDYKRFLGERLQPDQGSLEDQQRDLESIKKRRPEALRKESAELAALFAEGVAEPFKNSKADRIILIATRTGRGEYCGALLRRFLEVVAKAAEVENPSQAVDLRFPPYLGSATQVEFAEKGLPAFLDSCLEIIREARGAEASIVLAPNGGYKTLLGYLTLLGLLEELPIRYVYEESDKLLLLPQLPVGVDQLTWQHERLQQGALVGQKWDPERPAYKRLRYRALLRSDPQGTERFAPTQLAEYIESKYGKLVGRLRQFLRGTILSPSLENREKIDFPGMLLRLATIADHIWLGDRLPYVVDHGQAHHYDLFEIAEQILAPLFHWQPRFLQAEELFVLLGAVALHDCGHVVGRVDGRDLTSLEIRNHHHMLGYLRLKAGATTDEPEMLAGPIYENLLKEAGSEGTPWRLPRAGAQWTNADVWDNFLEAIATVGVYHRQKTPLYEPMEKAYRFLGKVEGLTEDDGTLKPLEHVGDRKCGGLTLGPARMVLLASLLRVIDCLDQKSSRTGPPAYVAFHKANLQRQIESLKRRAAQIKEVLPQLREKLDAIDGVAEHQIHQEIKNIEATTGLDTASITLASEYARNRAELLFHADQEKHFTCKERIRQVGIQPKKEGDGFEVRLHFHEGFTTDQRKEAEREILGEIEKELAVVQLKATLNRYGISFHLIRGEDLTGGSVSEPNSFLPSSGL